LVFVYVKLWPVTKMFNKFLKQEFINIKLQFVQTFQEPTTTWCNSDKLKNKCHVNDVMNVQV